MARHSLSMKSKKALIIAIVAVILIIAIAFCVLYFGFPSTWDNLMKQIRGEESSSLELGEGELKVHFINVGQGDCAYIQFPDGTDMIIDCGNVGSGPSYSSTKKYISDLNPDGKINHLMLTHCDEDHVDDLDEIIYDFEIENIYMPNVLAAPTSNSDEANRLKSQINALDPNKLAMFTDRDTISTLTYARFFIAALSEENCTIHLNMDRDENTNSIVIEKTTYRFTFYCPTEAYYSSSHLSTATDKNAISPVGILEYNNRRVVFTGDSNEGNEETIARRIGSVDCDVLKVAHHGSATSSAAVFLDAITCEYAVISCGAGNSYGHPTQGALNRFSQRNMTVYRTDTNGTVVLTIDGKGKITFSMQTEVEQSVNLVGAAKSSS